MFNLKILFVALLFNSWRRWCEWGFCGWFCWNFIGSLLRVHCMVLSIYFSNVARARAAEKLLEDLKARKHVVPKGFINETIREMREAR
jgi:hypothetical protein